MVTNGSPNGNIKHYKWQSQNENAFYSILNESLSSAKYKRHLNADQLEQTTHRYPYLRYHLKRGIEKTIRYT